MTIPNRYFETLVLCILEGIFHDREVRKEVYDHIHDDLIKRLGNDFDQISCSQVQNAIRDIFYEAIMK